MDSAKLGQAIQRLVNRHSTQFPIHVDVQAEPDTIRFSHFKDTIVVHTRVDPTALLVDPSGVICKARYELLDQLNRESANVGVAAAYPRWELAKKQPFNVGVVIAEAIEAYCDVRNEEREPAKTRLAEAINPCFA